jgi:Sec-independent protein translocase protein TatA
MMGMGGMEILVILLVAFILLGPAKMVEASRSLGKLVGQMRRMADQIPHVDLKEFDNELTVDDEKNAPDISSNIHDVSNQDISNKNTEDIENVDAPVPFRSDVSQRKSQLDIDPKSVSKRGGDRDSGSAGL